MANPQRKAVSQRGNTAKRARRFIQQPATPRGLNPIQPRTVLQAIRREQLASHASLMARIDYLLDQMK